MDEQFEEVVEEMHHHEFLELFEKLTFRQKVRKVLDGLKAPKDSGAYKYAKLQLLRLWAPVCAVFVPIVSVMLLVAFAAMNPPKKRDYEVRIMEPEEVPELEEIEELKEEPIEPPEPIDMDFTPDVTITDPTPSPSPPTDFSPQPAKFDSVAMVKSPVIMRNMYGSRSPGARGSMLAQHGGSGETEGAVMRALRWLKKEQNEDGSWRNCRPAMTALALLTYLAHGETPASEEFGYTVEKAIRWLVDNQLPDGSFKGRDGHDYSHPIATYALCEGYGLTRVPMVHDAAFKAAERVIKGQNESGGFNYNLVPTTRDDTSYMGWCAQALKAAKMAGLHLSGLDEAMRKAIEGFKKNYGGDSTLGGFGYTGPSRAGGLTGVGVLCMQLLGAANAAEVTGGLNTLEQVTFNWEPVGFMNKNYYWYYITQAKFHHGGETWDKWNNLFAPTLVKNQTVIEKAIEGPGGEMFDIGYWDMPKGLAGHTDGVVMDTCLCTLQLEVYYRYLPTYKTPEVIEAGPAEVASEDDVDIEININI